DRGSIETDQLLRVQLKLGVALRQCLFRLLALGDVVKAIDCSRDFSSFGLQWTDIHHHGHPRAVGALDDHFRVVRGRYFSGDHPGHGTLLVGHEAAVRTEQLERAAKPRVGIPWRWLAPPQFHGTAVELLNHAGRITGIDGHGIEVEQGAIAFLARAQLFLRLLAPGDVASDFRCADRAACRILDGRNGQRYFQQRTIFTQADGFEMVHTFATLEPRENVRLFVLAVRRNEHRNGLADGFLGRVAEQTLRAFIPTGDNAVEVFANDGVVRGIDNRSQLSGDDIGVLPLGWLP